MITNTSLDDFYLRNGAPLPEGIAREIGHFNVFETEKLFDKKTGARIMPYSRRAYYKISWLRGKSRVEYADKVIDVQEVDEIQGIIYFFLLYYRFVFSYPPYYIG